jgi:hypothetical protein
LSIARSMIAEPQTSQQSGEGRGRATGRRGRLVFELVAGPQGKEVHRHHRSQPLLHECDLVGTLMEAGVFHEVGPFADASKGEWDLGPVWLELQNVRNL